jgi:sugar phosphate isomerase/epimerase
MRLAVAVATSESPGIEDQSALAARLGVTGVNIDVRQIVSLGESPASAVGRIRGAGVAVSQVACWDYNPLIPDAGDRREVERAIELAGLLGGRCTVVFGAGGLNAQNPWIHDPANWTPRARSRAADSIRPLAEMAEAVSTRIALEPHFANVCRDAESTLALLEAIGSDAVGLSMDVVNYCTFEDYWDTTRLIDNVVKPLGRYCFAAHLKDVSMEPKLIVHMNECPAGTGALDYRHLLMSLDAVMNESDWAIVEHTPLDRLPEAFRFIRERAGDVGVHIR